MLEQDGRLARIQPLLWRTGFIRFGRYLAGGMEAGREMAEIPQMTMHDLKASSGSVQPLDVRNVPGSWMAWTKAG